jgi:hypothetical protein
VSARIPLLALLLLAFALPVSAKPQLKGSAPAEPGERTAEPRSAPEPNEEGLIEVMGAGGPHEGVHEAPHGGALIPLGRNHAHLELLVDPDDGNVQLWFLDGEAKEPIRVGGNLLLVRFHVDGEDIPLPLFPAPDEAAGESRESTSRFAAGHQKLIGRGPMTGIIERVSVRKRIYKQVPFHYPEGNEIPSPDGGR